MYPDYDIIYISGNVFMKAPLFMPDLPENKPEQPENHQNDDSSNVDPFDTDILSRLRDIPRPKSPFQARLDEVEPEPEPDEEFWAIFSMITPTGERFVINACFRNSQHYNAEMHKFETSKNIHIVLKDANGESIVIKRDLLLHVLPYGQQEVPDKKHW
jgi:hypothetical protein